MNITSFSKIPYWIISTEDKPSRTGLNDFINKNNRKNIDIPIDFQGVNNCKIVLDVEDVNNIKYFFTEYKNTTLYYFLNDYELIANNKAICTYSIDEWCSFKLFFLDKTKEINPLIDLERSHWFFNESLQFNDPLLEEIEPLYNEVNVRKIEINKKLSTIKNIENNNINSCLYYVFNDQGGANGYIFLPLLNTTTINPIVDFGNVDYVETEQILFTPFFKSQQWTTHIAGASNFSEYTYSGSPNDKWIKPFAKSYNLNGNFIKNYTLHELDEYIIDKLNNNWVVEYYFKGIKQNQMSGITASDLYNNLKGSQFTYDWTNINTKFSNLLIKNIKPSRISALIGMTGFVGALGDPVYSPKFYIDGAEQTDYIRNWANDWYTEFRHYPYNHSSDEQDARAAAFLSQLLIKIKKPVGVLKESNKSVVNNNYQILEMMKNSKNWSNKFVGIYFLPNIYTSKSPLIRTIRIEKLSGEIDNYKFLDFNIPSFGTYVNPFEIYNYVLWTDVWLLNNDMLPNNVKILKYYNIKYYNNFLDLSKRVEHSRTDASISLGGFVFFNSQLNMVAKTRLLDLNNSLITYPAQLPSGTDTYKQYVSTQINTVETSYSISKQQRNIKIGDASFNFANDIASGASKALGGITTGQIGVGMEGVSQIANAPYKLGRSIRDSILNLKNKERMERARFADMNNTLGNKLNLSNVQDAMWMTSNLDNKQYEVVEEYQPHPSYLKKLNNVITKYGHFTLIVTKFNETILNKNYSYIKLNNLENFNNSLKDFNNLKLPNLITWNYFNEFKNDLLNGIRLWNIGEVIYEEFYKN